MTFLSRKDDDDTFDSIEWCFETHLKQLDNKEFKTAVLWGNEDFPTEIFFYKSESPTWFSQPDMIWKNQR